MRVLRGPPITGAKMSSSRVGELANLAVVEGNGLNHSQKKKGVLLYNLIPHPVPPQHLLLDLSVEGLEDGPGGLEEAEGVCLHVRESGHQGPKVEARLPLHLEREEQRLLEVQRGLGCSRRGWTITVETVVASLPWPLPILHHLPATSRSPVSTFPLILPTHPPLPLKNDIQPYILESPPLPSHPVSHLPLTLPSPPLLHPSPTTLSPPGPSPPPALPHPE